jgi:gamma-glutamylcyclotransferase (GGCT)/AIG2-like uncharacterized protein YtfP
MILAVNGTLMRGLELNSHLLDAGGVFISEAITAPVYRLWSIHDAYPGMVRDDLVGVGIAVELWKLPAEGILQVLSDEPEGLCVGKVALADGQAVLGILAEAIILEGCQEITKFGSWRNYLQSK